MIYELRTYWIHPGRMTDILNRFESKSFALLAKHHIQVIDFWQDLSEDKIYYVVEHKDYASGIHNFEAFVQDPEWQEVKRLSELGGPIVAKVERTFMSRAPFSPMNSKRGANR